MNSSLTQIKEAYETNNMSLEEIAEDQGLELAVVKASLMNCSSRYRKLCNKEEEGDDGLNFSNQELRDVNRVIMELALGSEDEHLRFKAASYIRDDKKGRKEVVRQLANNNTFNILNFNEQLAAARDLKKRLIEV